MANAKKKEAGVYVVVKNGIVSGNVYTSLKDACGDAGVSYQDTVRKKKLDWECKDGSVVFIRKCSVIRIQGRTYNRCRKNKDSSDW